MPIKPEIIDVEDPEGAAKQWLAKKRRTDEGKIQRRYHAEEVRLDYPKDGNKRIVGYAAVFNKEIELWGGLFETIAPGAFADAIKEDDVRALFNHDPSLILGRTKAQTLTLSEDEKGLSYSIIPPDTSTARDLLVSIKRKDVSQSSFGFEILKRSVEIDEEKDEMHRTIEKVKLYDVSPVTFPAYPQTEVNVRMFRSDCMSVFCFEDDAQPILVPLEKSPEEISDEDVFQKLDALKAGLSEKGIR